MQDDYEGDFTTRRVLYYTLRFTAKTYLFGPSHLLHPRISSKGLLSVISLEQILSNTRREVTYSATARALKSYTDNVVTTLAADITATAKTALKLLMLLELKQISISSLEMKNYSLDLRLVINLQLIEGEIIQNQRNTLLVRMSKELTIQRQNHSTILMVINWCR